MTRAEFYRRRRAADRWNVLPVLFLLVGLGAMMSLADVVESALGAPLSATGLLVFVLGCFVPFGAAAWWNSGRKYRWAGLACPSCGAPLVDSRRVLDLDGSSCGKCGAAVIRDSAAERAAAEQLPTRAEMQARMEDAYRPSRWEQGIMLASMGAIGTSAVQHSRIEARPPERWEVLAFLVVMCAGFIAIDWIRARRIRALGLRCATCRSVLAPQARKAAAATLRAGACWYCAARVLRYDAPEPSRAGSVPGR